ncbi:MAG: 3-dehydroquinate synthase [Clostridiaceae bacterium]|jgi:3-dehydroquinate synthase|nr:3-dehydroquinate synthase [Clostridiaceae bacterium]
MQKLDVRLAHKTYPIFIGNGLFQKSFSMLKQFINKRKAIIITDSNLKASCGCNLMEILGNNGIDAKMCVIPAGESSKSLDELTKLYSFFANFGITRSDYIIALGGGVTGDLAGFAASTWLRGTGFIQIPTSLLAMVDSSIGGKVAVNMPFGKNLVGSFYHPEAVLIDPLLLKTLPDRHFADGMAEVIKYGCIDDNELFVRLERLSNRKDIMKHIEDIIYICCDIKRRIVEMDERESNTRMVLNFGHTFGHAVESYYNYKKYTHGEAISIGMVFIAELSHKLGYCKEEVVERLKKLLEKTGLPVRLPDMKPKDVITTVLTDKKARTDNINLVLIKDIGNVVIEKFPKDRIGGYIHEVLDN